MSSSTIRLIACRAYAFLFGIFGVCLMLGGLVGLYLSAYGAPPELRDALARAHLQESGAMLLFIIGAATIVFGALHAVVGFFASKGHVWPLITGTVCWLLIFGPSLWGGSYELDCPARHVRTVDSSGGGRTHDLAAAAFVLMAA